MKGHIGAQRLALPVLTPASLWEKSGRWQAAGDELMKLRFVSFVFAHDLMRCRDRRGTEFCLGPTHEEAITDLVASVLSSHKQLPWMLYQVRRLGANVDSHLLTM